MLKNSFEFKLEHPIAGGKVTELILYAPRNLHRPKTAKLDAMIRGGMLEIQAKLNAPVAPPTVEEDNDSGNPFDSMSALQIVEMIKMMPSTDFTFYPLFCDTFRGLILSVNICKIKDSDAQLNEGYYDQMVSADGDRLMGEYIKNFFIISTSS